jgi:F420-dependent oxidoreductase-like protein
MDLGFWPGTQFARGRRPDLPTPERPWDQIRATAAAAEAGGWDSVWVSDHFMATNDAGEMPQLEAWTLLAGLAATVPRVRLGVLVSSVTYRHPAVLANMAVTVDHISGGRVTLGLGAGWQTNEHEAYGIEFEPAPARASRLAEAAEVVVRLRDHTPASFAGDHYRLVDAPLSPPPLGPMPLMIGGNGEQRTMRIAARYADEWNGPWLSPADFERKSCVLDRYCEEIGRDPSEIRRSTCAVLAWTDDAEERAFMNALDEGSSEAFVIGDSSEVATTLEAYERAGVDELILPDVLTFGTTDQTIDRLDAFQATFRSPGSPSSGGRSG